MAKPKKPARTFKTDAALFAGLTSDDYPVRSAAQEYVVAMFASLAPAAATARAHELAAAALASTQEIQRATGHNVLPILVEHGAEVPAAYDSLVSGYGVIEELRAVLASLPVERRIAILRREVLGGDAIASSRVREYLLDLISKAASGAILRAHEEAGEDAHEAEEPAAPRALGPFTFTEPTVFWPEKYPDLDAIDKAQFRAAGVGYMGGVVKSGDHFIKRLPANDLDTSDREWRRWKVMRDGVHKYDVWVFWVDNASVFPARKSERAHIQMVQGSWQAMKQTAAAKKLADEVERSAPRDLWTVPKANKKSTTKTKLTKQSPAKKRK